MIGAGSEPKKLRDICEKVSNLPEEYGVDFYWEVEGKQWGVQRKELNDFFASVIDERLGKELLQGRRLDYPILLIEGRPSWTTDGTLASSWGGDGKNGKNWTRSQFDNLLLSIIFKLEWRIFFSDDIAHTSTFLQAIELWSRETDHTSLLRRPKLRTPWGTAEAEDFQTFLLQGIPGIGYNTARDIVTHLGGSPFSLRSSIEDLTNVPGVGRKTAEVISRAVTPGAPPDETTTKRLKKRKKQ